MQGLLVKNTNKEQTERHRFDRSVMNARDEMSNEDKRNIGRLKESVDYNQYHIV